MHYPTPHLSLASSDYFGCGTYCSSNYETIMPHCFKEKTNFKEQKESPFFRPVGNKGNRENRKDKHWREIGRRGRTEKRFECFALWCFLQSHDSLVLFMSVLLSCLSPLVLEGFVIANLFSCRNNLIVGQTKKQGRNKNVQTVERKGKERKGYDCQQQSGSIWTVVALHAVR